MNRDVIPPSPIRITISCNQSGRLETLEFPSPRKYKHVAGDTNNDLSEDINIVQQPQNSIRITRV